MAGDIHYTERLASAKTTALFAALAVLFAALLAWRYTARGLDGLAIAFLVLFLIFLFYVANYRTLLITITTRSLRLKFGLFQWAIPVDNIADAALDDVPPLQRYGGAGIHFIVVRKRYRASFNFLEYPRVVAALKRPAGPVRDVSFSTRRPQEVIRLLAAAAPTPTAADPARSA